MSNDTVKQPQKTIVIRLAVLMVAAPLGSVALGGEMDPQQRKAEGPVGPPLEQAARPQVSLRAQPFPFQDVRLLGGPLRASQDIGGGSSVDPQERRWIADGQRRNNVS